MKHYELRSKYVKIDVILTVDKHFFASSARSTKRRVRGMLMSVELKAPTDRSRSDCVHEQVAKLGPVSRATGMDCECPLYSRRSCKRQSDHAYA